MSWLGAHLGNFAWLRRETLAAWIGTDRLSALPPLVRRIVDRDFTRAEAGLALFVAGATIDRALLAELDLVALAEAGLLEVDGRRVRARVAVLPIGAPMMSSLLVCDRLDAPIERELVCWPDDSSYHLGASLPHDRERGTWIDVGCGSAFAQLQH